jgi:hypothetical protein
LNTSPRPERILIKVATKGVAAFDRSSRGFASCR